MENGFAVNLKRKRKTGFGILFAASALNNTDKGIQSATEEKAVDGSYVMPEDGAQTLFGKVYHIEDGKLEKTAKNRKLVIR